MTGEFTTPALTRKQRQQKEAKNTNGRMREMKDAKGCELLVPAIRPYDVLLGRGKDFTRRERCTSSVGPKTD